MAEFTYTFLISYLGNGDGAGDPQATSSFSGTLNDGETDGVFDLGDVVTGATLGTASSTGVYLGTTVVAGEAWPVFYHAATNESIVYTNVFIPFSLRPATLDVNEGNTFDAPCFLAGTMISTPEGEAAVEDLRIGDTILTADGAPVAVKWIGRRSVAAAFRPADRLMPVCIRAGALGQGLPLRDLRLTGDHALLMDGLLVNAGALVNGTTVVSVPFAQLGESYTVYHIETEAHQVILAEGVPAETYIDYLGRQAFENHAEYLALYGEDRAIVEMAAPRITSARQLPPALRARLDRDVAA